jgi:hypothetical protein
LQFGDRNINYFHNFAKLGRQRNRIKRFSKDQGNWVGGNDYSNSMIPYYFSRFFSTEVYDTDPPELLEKVVPGFLLR